MKKEIVVRTELQAEIETRMLIAGKGQLASEETSPIKNLRVVSRVYLDGALSSTKESVAGGAKGDAAIRGMGIDALMLEQHRKAIEMLRGKTGKEAMNPTEYLKEARLLLRRNKGDEAYALLSAAHGMFPSNPFILSYYGCLKAVVAGQHAAGIKACLEAITDLEAKVPFGQDFFYPTFYLNLGRAYVAGGKKRRAIHAFGKGLMADGGNREIRAELDRLGARKPPAIPFLARSNPINKYIGMVLHKQPVKAQGRSS